MTLEELKDQERVAWSALQAVRAQIAAISKERTDAFQAALAVELKASFGAALLHATDAEWSAKEAVEAEKERLSLSGDGLPYPIGTKLRRWDRGHSYSRQVQPKHPTNNYGVLEVCTKDSKFPENARWRVPKRGDWFVRLLKKNGEPGLTFESRVYKITDWWVPEGIDANAVDEPA